MSTDKLSDRLRAMHAAKAPHLVKAGQEPAYSVIATEQRWMDLLTAADMLDALDAIPSLDDVAISSDDYAGCVFDRSDKCMYPGAKAGCGKGRAVYVLKGKE